MGDGISCFMKSSRLEFFKTIINHSMVEDPVLFLAFGLSAFWLWIPRLITAVVAVRLFDLYYKINKQREQRND
jgi:hypothetical protein